MALGIDDTTDKQKIKKKKNSKNQKIKKTVRSLTAFAIRFPSF
jgi:hypothetical protein